MGYHKLTYISPQQLEQATKTARLFINTRLGERACPPSRLFMNSYRHLIHAQGPYRWGVISYVLRALQLPSKHPVLQSLIANFYSTLISISWFPEDPFTTPPKWAMDAMPKHTIAGTIYHVMKDCHHQWKVGRPAQHLMKHMSQSFPCLLYTSPSPRDQRGSRMPSSA